MYTTSGVHRGGSSPLAPLEVPGGALPPPLENTKLCKQLLIFYKNILSSHTRRNTNVVFDF